MMSGGMEANTALSPDFQDFIVFLNEHKVDFVLIGGYALGVHGVIRATGDIDFLYRRTKKNVKALVAAMNDFGAPPGVVDKEALMTAGIVTQFGQQPQRIDLLNEIDGVMFSEVWKGATTARVDGQKMRVIGLTELQKNKGATGQPKDEEDLRRLKAREVRKARRK
jgi:predicted nucleotidyltransferase